ncbi:MAG: tetratricopeptide repeat protein [Lentisphaeria bacterium]|nr:tetratricopeptide repeat protein [Lentisphaeria bacterium]
MSYEIFLSYAHKDADMYGKEYIDEIKRQIEESLQEKDIVFLDADALKLGNEWNAKIQDCLEKSKVFICLISENYIKSEYCTRERLWWAQKEMAKGQLNQSTLPMFYIDIDKNADAETQQKISKLKHLQSDKTFHPWFPEGVNFTAKELVKKRLDEAGVVARIQEIRQNSVTVSKIISSVPPYNQRFVGRIDELCKIRQICSHRGMEIDSIPVLHGEAGCGKSEISFSYAHGYASEYPGGCFFVPMESVKSWSSAWIKLADEVDKNSGYQIYEMLGLSKDDRKQVPEEFAKSLAQQMFVRVNNVGRSLMLLDNIDCMELLTEAGLRTLFATGTIPENLDIIATTRITPVLDGCSKAVAVPIGNLDEDAAMELLRLHCETTSFNQAPPQNDQTTSDAKELLAFLEYHAWSVEIIAGYLGRESKYGTTPQDVLEQLKQNFEIKTKYGSFRDIPDCTEKLLQPTVDKIKELEMGEEIIEFATAAAMFSPDAVGVKLLELLWLKRHGDKKCSKKNSWLLARETLKDYHLLSAENNGISRMHRLTHSYFQKCNQDTQQELAADFAGIIEKTENKTLTEKDAKAIFGLAQFILAQSWKGEFAASIISWINTILLEWYYLDESENLLDELEAIVEISDNPELKADLASLWGNFYEHSCHYEMALTNYNKALNIRLKSLPDNHPDIASSYNNIGGAYLKMGEYENALTNFNKALDIRLQTLPKNHLGIASFYNNIGGVYLEMGEYENALTNFNKALDIRLQTLPKNHPDFAISYDCIGGAYINMGQYENALTNHNKALDIRLKSLPENHPDFAISYNCIGCAYIDMGEYENALTNLNKALDIRLQTLPPNHLGIAKLYGNIGSVYSYMGQYNDALTNLNKALDIRLQTLPPNHPDIAISYSSIGCVYSRTGQYENALTNYNKVLDIRLQTLPENHPDFAISYDCIGGAYIDMGQYENALTNLNKALDIRLQTLPPNHPDIASSYNNIGSVYSKIKQYENALTNLNKSLATTLQVLPENHPSIATLYNNIGYIYDDIAQYEKALMYYNKALDIRLHVLPENHPDIASSYNSIGRMYDDMGQYENALKNLCKALEIQLQTLPDDHPDIASSYNSIGCVYSRMGQYKNALTNLNKSLGIITLILPKNHPYITSSLNNIGGVYEDMGQYENALIYYNKVLEIYLQTLPDNHPDLAELYTNIGRLYECMGQDKNAVIYYNKASEINDRIED